ncbi:aminotransferase class I/II-fold pyridoxal phosphate-dependent enzyme [Robertkochia sediminum]|uniref:aminotransferase class I/II-fold pyridoxal phosphate-dependent enzyme n=1 Tax=Robertkochia sediminum TaxID=2785326 RepID=UPI001932C8B7|nr:8-amino-7-oxononanoate synthase [Robertkochia sediminum]MBL7471958.1 8-amino-7-oxononanoate synthase [Robertkochia sediminum]
MKFPEKLNQKLAKRIAEDALRTLSGKRPATDFSSNDYLGLSRSEMLWQRTHEILETYEVTTSGSTGSRLISGDHALYKAAEDRLKEHYLAEDALIFNSGYDANVGFFSAVPQRGDVVIYDEYIHASVRDGLQMGIARKFKFPHNDLSALEGLLDKFADPDTTVYVVTESVFSMDGDRADLPAMVELCRNHHAYLIVDEAHAVGIIGEGGRGASYDAAVRDKVFARIVTFGKAPGVHGAAVLGSATLKQYLVNFARSLIYTTALPPHALAAIMASHELMKDDALREALEARITLLAKNLQQLPDGMIVKAGNSAISTVVIPGNERVKQVSDDLMRSGYDVKAILSPTVPEGQERLRICLHTYNSFEEIGGLIERLLIFVNPSRENV